jgi:hypothetical protein
MIMRYKSQGGGGVSDKNKRGEIDCCMQQQQ